MADFALLRRRHRRRTPRVVKSKRKARKLDPGKLGVGQMVKSLEKAEQGPLRAGATEFLQRKGRGERVAGAALMANVAARRQRAARELAERRKQPARYQDAHAAREDRERKR